MPFSRAVNSLLPLAMVAAVGAGCDAIHTTRLYVSVDTVDGSADDLVLESRWFRVPAPIVEARDAAAVRAAGGHTITADWPNKGPKEPGVPVRGGAAEVEYLYAVFFLFPGPRPLSATWLAVSRLPRTEWVPQEFVIVDEGGALVVRRIVRSDGTGALGDQVGVPEKAGPDGPAEDAWLLVLPLGPWGKQSLR